MPITGLLPSGLTIFAKIVYRAKSQRVFIVLYREGINQENADLSRAIQREQIK